MKNTRTYSLSVANRPISTGSYDAMKKKVMELAPADRLRGWTIAPVDSCQAEDTPTPAQFWWALAGGIFILFFLFILAMTAKGC